MSRLDVSTNGHEWNLCVGGATTSPGAERRLGSLWAQATDGGGAADVQHGASGVWALMEDFWRAAGAVCLTGGQKQA